MNIRLEYSQALGQFNQAKADDPTDKGKGFETLSCFMNADRAVRFIERVIAMHPELGAGIPGMFPTLATLKEELLRFLEEDIRLLNEQMARSFRRRQTVYSNYR